MIKAKDRKQTNRQKAKSRTIRSRTDSGSSSSPRRSRALTKRGAKIVWHIFRFEERYELSSDSRYPREKPLMFTRDFVGSGNDDESACHYQQLQILKSKQNYLMLRGSFAELKSIAANRARSFRGYILDQHNQPASDKTIGLWLGVSEKQAEQILSDIAEAGLIELVPLPDFKPEKSTKAKTGKRKKSSTKKSKSRGESKKAADSKSQENSVPAQENPRVTRENTGALQEGSVSLLNKRNLNLKLKQNLKPKFEPEYAIGADKDREINNKRQRESKETSSSLEGKQQTNEQCRTATAETAERSLAPTTTPPIKPKEADTGGSLITFIGPLGSDTRLGEGSSSRSRKRSEPQQLGNIAQGILRRYNPEAKSFAGDVFEALQLSCHPLSQQGKREAASFAALWQRAYHSGLSPPTLAELRERAIAEARRIVKSWNGRRGKPAAVWCKIFGEMIAKTRMAKIVS